MLPQCNPVMRPRNARPSTRGPQSAYRPAERAEGGLCALRAAPNPMSEREHELHRRMTSLTERHRAWPRSWARTERAVPRDPFAGGVGSSPHTRGARAIGSHARLCRRDHPRIRGEHSARLGAHAVLAGIIPAYAGNTMISSQSWVPVPGSSPHTRGTLPSHNARLEDCGDHPRIRGEHLAISLCILPYQRIIPAYAGNTRAGPPDHLPRQGSSPHTRGTLVSIVPLASLVRDHPRIRGEHRLLRPGCLRCQGIIPAYAGNTAYKGRKAASNSGSSPHTRGTLPVSLGAFDWAADHPRIRGEHLGAFRITKR